MSELSENDDREIINGFARANALAQMGDMESAIDQLRESRSIAKTLGGSIDTTPSYPEASASFTPQELDEVNSKPAVLNLTDAILSQMDDDEMTGFLNQMGATGALDVPSDDEEELIQQASNDK